MECDFQGHSERISGVEEEEENITRDAQVIMRVWDMRRQGNITLWVLRVGNNIINIVNIINMYSPSKCNPSNLASTPQPLIFRCEEHHWFPQGQTQPACHLPSHRITESRLHPSSQNILPWLQQCHYIQYLLLSSLFSQPPLLGLSPDLSVRVSEIFLWLNSMTEKPTRLDFTSMLQVNIFSYPPSEQLQLGVSQMSNLTYLNRNFRFSLTKHLWYQSQLSSFQQVTWHPPRYRSKNPRGWPVFFPYAAVHTSNT